MKVSIDQAIVLLITGIFLLLPGIVLFTKAGTNPLGYLLGIVFSGIGAMVFLSGLGKLYKAAAPLLVGIVLYALMWWAVAVPGTETLIKPVILLGFGIPGTILIVEAARIFRKSRRTGGSSE